MKVNERFINDWMATKETFITHFFPNWEDPSRGAFQRSRTCRCRWQIQHCPRFRPHHFVDFGPIVEPHPVPWKEINAAEQVQIAYLFTKFSSLTLSPKFNKALKSIATEILGGVAGRLADEFEKCGTLPRPPKHLNVLQN